MNEPPQISITCRDDLRKYFPNLEINKFERLSGGKKYHGPCPVCGGTDRFNIWYWASKGIWMAECSHGYHVYNKKGEAKRIICVNRLDDSEGYTLSPKELFEIEKARKEQEKKEFEEKCLNFKRITGLQIEGVPIWQFYHERLLEKPDLIQSILEHDGITLDTLREFSIGYNPKFRVYHKEDDTSEEFDAIVFPTFHWLTIEGQAGFWLTNLRHRLLGATRDKYRPFSAGLGVDYFNAWIEGCDRMVIVEGEKKAMRLKQEGIPTIGLWGTQAWYEWWIPEWKRMAPMQITVLFDHEADPEKQKKIWAQGERLVSMINRGGAATASQVLLPDVGKIDDQLNSGQIDIDQLISLLDSSGPVQIR